MIAANISASPIGDALSPCDTAKPATSAGAEAGIKPGDAIVEINRQPVGDVAAFQALVAGLKPGESVPVYLQRGGGGAEYVMLTAPRP